MVAEARTTQDLLAANLRRLRIARQLSLSELARATGMSKATLSGIENARANPTVETLASLAGALRVSMIELLEELPLGEIRIARATDAKYLSRDGVPRRTLESLTPEGPLEIGEIALKPRELRDLAALGGGARRSVFVIDGTLIAGPVERSTELGAGDYMSFPADVPHVLMAGRRATRALLLTHGRA
jgi:transcriptional regulator with XRE-family HTH domain